MINYVLTFVIVIIVIGAINCYYLKKNTAYYFTFFCVFLNSISISYSQDNVFDTLFSSLHSDVLYEEGGDYFQDVYFVSSGEAKVAVGLKLYRQDNGDSTIVYSIQGEGFEAAKGANRLTIPFKDRRVRANVKEGWLAAYKAAGRMPVGNYSCFIEITESATQQRYTVDIPGMLTK